MASWKRLGESNPSAREEAQWEKVSMIIEEVRKYYEKNNCGS
jgi:hypothetical protein